MATGLATASAKLIVDIPLHDPCNIFEAGQEVKFEATIQGGGEKKTEFAGKVTDFFGNEIWSKTIEGSGNKVPVGVDLGKLPNGYYELKWTAKAGEEETTGRSTFGVATLVDRDPKDVLAGVYRFGLKIGGYPKDFDYIKAMTISARMGLVWTRERFDKDIDILNKIPTNVVMKVEMFPEEAYDEKRYGPREEFKLRHFGWQKATVPLEAPYKKWLKEIVSKAPKEQKVFEIWNEPWGKLPPGDFVKVAQMTQEAIREVRPDAIIGPNLGHLYYDDGFIKAGGMKGLDMLALHPYGHPERTNLRQTIREIRKFYKERIGRDLDMYVTEFGSSTPPDKTNSPIPEINQANKAVRASLAFYAEDIKGFMPHWMGQLEKNPTDSQHWYGYFRANAEPKPALLAMATAAREFDGKRYVGDIFLKPDVGAMLFEDKGKYTLVLWTNDVDLPVEVNVGIPEVTVVDIMGKATSMKTQGGKLSLNLTGNPVYLRDVSPDLAKTTSTEIREDQWPTGKFVRGSRVAHRMKAAPTIDGKVSETEWNGQTKIDMPAKQVPATDAGAIGYVSWDKDYLYVAADVTDNDPYYNPNKPYDVYDADSLELFINSDVKYQIPDFLHSHDVQMMFAPTSADGKPVAGAVNREGQKLEEIPGLKMATVKTDKGWAIELAIPLAFFNAFTPEVDHMGAFEMRINDADAKRTNRVPLNPVDGRPHHIDATKWDYLKLVD